MLILGYFGQREKETQHMSLEGSEFVVTQDSFHFALYENFVIISVSYQIGNLHFINFILLHT